MGRGGRFCMLGRYRVRMLITWLVAGVYLAGLVLTSRKVAVALANDDTMAAEDAVDQAGNRALAVIIGAFWPLVLAGALITGKLPRSDRQIRADLAERDKRIADLERELGIGRR